MVCFGVRSALDFSGYLGDNLLSSPSPFVFGGAGILDFFQMTGSPRWIDRLLGVCWILEPFLWWFRPLL